jgi:hypothetical protein
MNHAPYRGSKELLFNKDENLFRAPMTPRTCANTALGCAPDRFTNGWSNHQ